jgi:hypothetical protein
MTPAAHVADMECAEADCESEATFELHVPWAEDEYVCAGHARTRSRKDGVVADPLDAADEELPEGASHRDESA